MQRSLSPSERRVLAAVIAPFTFKQVHRVVCRELGREVPVSTVSGALTNLTRWGYLSVSYQTNPRGNARRGTWRRVAP